MTLESKETQEAVSLEKQLEADADTRAAFTRNYLEGKGISLKRLCAKLAGEPFRIEINPDDDKSLTLGVAELQKQLGFRQVDSPRGCDGKLGPLTWRKYRALLIREKSRSDRHELAEKKPAATVEEAPRARESVAETATLAETIFIGDSLSAGMASAGAIEGAHNCYKGAMQSGWMLKEFRRRFFDETSPGQYSLKEQFRNGRVKKVVVEGGLNDITSLKSVASVTKNLAAIYKLAREAGLTVVACTYPDWDAEKGVKIFQRDFKKHGWGDPPGTYPLTPDELQRRTAELHQWIRAQHAPAQGLTVVDLHNEMTDRRRYPRADFVHPNRQGSRAMAEYIMREGAIAGD